MKIVSWNVNGLLTTLKDATHRFTSASIYFTTVLHADIVCFQEAKIQEDKLEKWMACVPGFESFWAFSQAKKGYSGVVTYVKDDISPLLAAAENLPGDASAVTEDLCREGRVIETDHGSFVLINVYVPNAGDRGEGRPRLDFKVRFLQALKRKCDELVSSGRHVVVVGDFNIAHKEIDVHKKWNVEEIYSSEENVWLDNFLTEYVDLFRHFHPDARDVFSVWEARTDARIHNEGLRIDYAVCDKGFLPQVKDTQILKMVPKNWSDHAAVVLTLQQQPALPPHPAASISSRNMKRFQEDRRQKKLTSLFSRGASKPMAVSNVVGGNVPPLQQENLVQGDASVSNPVTPKMGDPSSVSTGAIMKDSVQCTEGQEEGGSLAQLAPVSSHEKSTVAQDDRSAQVAGEAAGGNGNLGRSEVSDVIVHDLGCIQPIQPDHLQSFELLDTKHVAGHEKNGESKEGMLDSSGKSHVGADVIDLVLEPESGIPAEEGSEGSSLLKDFAVREKNGESKDGMLDSSGKTKVEADVIELVIGPGSGIVAEAESGIAAEAESGIVSEAGTEGSSPLKRKQPSEPLTETGAATGKQRSLTSYFKVATRENGGADDQCK